jgi:hypothetical protein
LREQLRVVAFTLMVLGGLLALVSLFADPLALGMPHSGFGVKQITGTVAGLAVAAAGILIWRRAER